MSLVVLMPTRGRPGKAREAIEEFEAHKALPDSTIVAVVDHDGGVIQSGDRNGMFATARVGIEHSGQGMGPALNGALDYAFEMGATVIGFLGDDHRARTPSFDQKILDANEAIGGGIIYGNDLIRGEELPTAVFMDARIVRALGWMALPGAYHLYLDDTWRELGKRMGRLKYLPDVICEHLHPIAGKADWDAEYARVNDAKWYDHDRAVYSQWLQDDLEMDAQRALAALR